MATFFTRHSPACSVEEKDLTPRPPSRSGKGEKETAGPPSPPGGGEGGGVPPMQPRLSVPCRASCRHITRLAKPALDSSSSEPYIAPRCHHGENRHEHRPRRSP